MIQLDMNESEARIVYEVLVEEWQALQEVDSDGAADDRIQVLDRITDFLADKIFQSGSTSK